MIIQSVVNFGIIPASLSICFYECNFSMFYEQLARQWDLLSEDMHGMLDVARLAIGQEWIAEDEERRRSFESLPVFDVNISEAFRQRARNGIPSGQRRKWWLVASGGFRLLSQVGDVWKSAKRATQLPADGRESFGFPIDILTFLPKALSRKVKMFCDVLCSQNPGIEFAPLIPISAALLLLYMEAPLAYVTIQSMLNQSRKDSFYFALSNTQFLTCLRDMHEILNRKCDSIVKHAESLMLDAAQLGISLFPAFLFPFMALPVALTLFDSFMIDGRKVLLKFCVSLYVSEKKDLLSTSNAREFVSVVINAIERLSSIEAMKKFLKSTFHMRTSPHRLTRILSSSFGKKHARDVPCHGIGEIRSIVSDVHSVVSSQDGRTPAPAPGDLHAAALAMQEHIANRTLPVIHGGKLLSDSMYCILRHQLPPTLGRYSLTLVFSSSVNGPSLQCLFDSCTDRTPYVLMVRTTYGLYGALLSDAPSLAAAPESGYYGRPVTFVFNADSEEVYRVQPPPNNMFISVAKNLLAIGGPEPAISLSAGMKKLVSHPCETFGSPPFTREQDGDDVIEIELYTFATVEMPAPPMATSSSQTFD